MTVKKFEFISSLDKCKFKLVFNFHISLMKIFIFIAQIPQKKNVNFSKFFYESKTVWKTFKIV